MGLRVIIENYARIKNVVRVKQLLDLAHQAGCLVTPFHLDVRRHVTTGTVFGLERAVVLVDDKLANIIHEACIALNFSGIAKILGKYEVQVAFKRMAKNDRLAIAVLPQ